MTTCKQHQVIDDKLDQILQTQAALVALLNEAVVKKDEFYKGLHEVRQENRKTVGLLVGILVTLGGALGAILKLA